MPYLGPKPVNVRSASSLIVDGNLTAGETVLDNGLTVDKDGNTVATFDRATSDGTIIDIQKDGTTVGSIGVGASALTIGKNDTGIRFADGANRVNPWNPSTNAARDGAIDLGENGGRFKDLYLSGGVYLGGTGAANQLDDYEEGTWTPSSGCGSAPTNSGKYTKVGRLVTVYGDCTFTGSGTPDVVITGLPFTVAETQTAGCIGYNTIQTDLSIIAVTGQTRLGVYNGGSSGVSITTGKRLIFTAVYVT